MGMCERQLEKAMICMRLRVQGDKDDLRPRLLLIDIHRNKNRMRLGLTVSKQVTVLRSCLDCESSGNPIWHLQMEAWRREGWSYSESKGYQNTSTMKLYLTILAWSKHSFLLISIVFISIIQQALNKFSLLFHLFKRSYTFTSTSLHCQLFPSAGHHITVSEHLFKALCLAAVKKP